MKHKKHELHNNEERIGRPVTDGNIVFENYQWRNDQIYSFWKRIIVSPYMLHDVPTYILRHGDTSYTRTRNQLLAHSFPQRYLPQNYNNWIDVFGFEDLYCFNPQNPNQVWSKRRMKLIKLSKNNNRHSQHLLFNSVKDDQRYTIYIHKIVWESYNKQEVPKGYVIHHVNHDCYDNRMQNMIILPREIHSTFEIYWTLYTKKSRYYIGEITKDSFIQKIENFDISEEDKQKLIRSI